jgi:hypothetical protein
VAVGYDYAIGPGDPRFASVTLPAGIGDDLYEIYLFDDAGRAYPAAQVAAGEVLRFEDLGVSGGVARFRVLGIEPSSGIDPTDLTAFVTGLSFTGDGAFTGTMTPITRDTDRPLLTGFGAAEAWIGLKNSDDVGTRFDVKAQVYHADALIGSGQQDGFWGGSSGFNNARRASIPLDLVAPPAEVPPGTVLRLTLSARIACAARTHASGSARLWSTTGRPRRGSPPSSTTSPRPTSSEPSPRSHRHPAPARR